MNAANDDEARQRPASPCPICGKPAAPATRPFCSVRCADVDLHRWLGGRYIVKGEEDEHAAAGEPRDDD